MFLEICLACKSEFLEFKQGSQCIYNVILWHFHIAVVALET